MIEVVDAIIEKRNKKNKVNMKNYIVDLIFELTIDMLKF